MKSIYLLKEDFKDFPIGEFPYDKNHSAMGEYHFIHYPGYYGKWYDPVCNHTYNGQGASWIISEYNGKHFMEQMRIVREMRLAEKARGRESVNIRPRWMCWENVPGAFSSGKPKYEDFRIVLEEIVRVCFPNELIPGPYPYGWPDVGDLTAGDMFSIAWRCLDAQLCGVAQRRKRIFLLADFAGPLAPQLLFDVFDETENSEKEVS